MRVEIRRQFVGSKRVSTFGTQPPQSETNGNWTDASSFLVKSQQASTEENWGDSLRTATRWDEIREVCQGAQKVGTSLTTHQHIANMLWTYPIRSSSDPAGKKRAARRISFSSTDVRVSTFGVLAGQTGY